MVQFRGQRFYSNPRPHASVATRAIPPDDFSIASSDDYPSVLSKSRLLVGQRGPLPGSQVIEFDVNEILCKSGNRVYSIPLDSAPTPIDYDEEAPMPQLVVVMDTTKKEPLK